MLYSKLIVYNNNDLIRADAEIDHALDLYYTCYKLTSWNQ